MLGNQSIQCILDGSKSVICNGTVYKAVEVISFHSKWFWIYLGIYVALVLLAGLMSGLTMGLLSLDVMSLTILSSDGKPHEQKYAKKILPLVKQHHLLLVTLLLSNAAAVESMPLFLDKISNPVTAVIVSVTAVLIFGEVVPQALCTRYGLAIGAAMSPFVMFLIIVTFPVSWPLAKILDCVLGKDHATFFRRAELKALVAIHKEEDRENEEPLTNDEVMVIQGALSMKEKTVRQICTPLPEVFYVDINGVMDEDMMDTLVNRGCSRVPVYDGDAKKFIGLMLVKNLIKINPSDKQPIRTVFERHKRTLLKVHEDMQLYEVLNLFQMGKSHMFVVVKRDEVDDDRSVSMLSDNDEVIGIVTLEDVIEELIQEEITDETDVLPEMKAKLQTAKARIIRRSISVSHSSFTEPGGGDAHPRLIADDGVAFEDDDGVKFEDDDDSAPLLSPRQ